MQSPSWSPPKFTVHAIKYIYRSWILPLWGRQGYRAPLRKRETSGSPWRPGQGEANASGARSVPAVVFDHVVEFNDVLPLFVFLAALKGLLLKRRERAAVHGQDFYS